ncbi:hypothetical protein Cyrtocomes_00350 [Candidatus Cyrtobacter comes]|uniref:Uncharacterized protein n=1 Tax=Candidatus Cyrtobacter comes TaxID=675776 RepID=A0ABU5L784_9RICK|nr:hypothetical protein [Candidatus Cyrtobacter comes]MDZ5761985.1 hypothetical protein [Candidatus Cyrtobacter comes]
MSIYLLNDGVSNNVPQKAAYADDPSNSLIIYKKCFNVIIEKMEQILPLLPNIAIIYSMADKNNENEVLFEKNTKDAFSIIEKIVEIYKEGIYSSDITNEESANDIIFLADALETIKWRIDLLQKCRKELYVKQIITLCLVFLKIINKVGSDLDF